MSYIRNGVVVPDVPPVDPVMPEELGIKVDRFRRAYGQPVQVEQHGACWRLRSGQQRLTTLLSTWLLQSWLDGALWALKRTP